MRIMLNCLQKVIIGSNSNLQENTTENQNLAKIIRNQLAAELKSKLEFKSRHKVQSPAILSHNINKFRFEAETET